MITTDFALSLIVPHANSTGLIKRLLDSLKVQDFPFPFEVLIVSNPPGRPCPFDPNDFVFPVRWLESARGANAARQKGVEAAQAPVLLFLDDDCWIEQPRFLQRHLELHQEQPDIMGFGGFYELRSPKTLSGEVYNEAQCRWLLEHRLPMNMTVHLLGGNSSYKRQVFEKNSFDTNLIFGGTETEFQVRLYHQKVPLKLSHEIPVAHEGVLSISSLLKKAFKQGMGSAYISSHHQRPPRFLFQSEDLKTESTRVRLLKWLYQISFHAGEKYFLTTRKSSVGHFQIWRRIGSEFLRFETYRRTPSWRRVSSLYKGITAGLLSSRHTSEKDSLLTHDSLKSQTSDKPPEKPF